MPHSVAMINICRLLTVAMIVALVATASAQTTKLRTIPPQFHGTWTLSETGVPAAGEEPLTISADKIVLHETLGTVRRVKQTRWSKNAYAVIVDASCEGQTGKERVVLRLSADGQKLTLKQRKTKTCGFGSGTYFRLR